MLKQNLSSNKLKHTMKVCASQPLGPLHSIYLNYSHTYTLVENLTCLLTIHQTHLSRALLKAVIIRYQ